MGARAGYPSVKVLHNYFFKRCKTFPQMQNGTAMHHDDMTVKRKILETKALLNFY